MAQEVPLGTSRSVANPRSAYQLWLELAPLSAARSQGLQLGDAYLRWRATVLTELQVLYPMTRVSRSCRRRPKAKPSEMAMTEEVVNTL